MEEPKNQNSFNDKADSKELQDKLLLAEKERDEYLNGWKRAKADLINAKKEWQEQLSYLGDYAKADFIKQFFPVLDALDSSGNVAGWQEVKKLLWDILKKNGVSEIDALGKIFDPLYHESVGENDGEEGRVVEVLQKGICFKNQVLRPARVIIGRITKISN